MSRNDRFHSLLVVAVVVATSLASALVMAAEPAGSVSVDVGPLGLGIGWQQRLTPDLSARVVLESGSLARLKDNDVELEGIHYDLSQRAGPGLRLLADYHPWHTTGWRLTGGLVLARVKTSLTGRPDGRGDYVINGHRYDADEVGTLRGRVKLPPVQLYLGGGWESRPAGTPGWRFVSDVGLTVTGRARATLSGSKAEGNDTLQQDLAAEARQLNRRGIGLLGSIGVAYGF